VEAPNDSDSINSRRECGLALSSSLELSSKSYQSLVTHSLKTTKISSTEAVFFMVEHWCERRVSERDRLLVFYSGAVRTFTLNVLFSAGIFFL
jgi:hypothetical protein